MKKQVILASASPRRKELLETLIESFEVYPCPFEESHPDLSPAAFVKYLASFEAQSVFDLLTDKNDKVVIGSDTIVVKNGKIIGKPKDEKDAKIILKKLSGKMHRVYTGVCLISDTRKKVFCVLSRVRFFKLTEKQIEDYISTGSAMDKAGAYGIQDSGFVKKVYGSKSCVVGLPIERLKKELKNFL